MEIRKIVSIIEETHREAGREVIPATRKAAAVAVIKNPLASRYEEDLSQLMNTGEELGELLGGKAVEALGRKALSVESYGKGAIVGLEGELEHAAAILHPKLGSPMRNAVGGGRALIPSAKKVGGPGTPIDVPLHHKDAAFVRSHFDAMEIRLPDAPRADEILVGIVVTDSGRPLARVGGLRKEEAEGEDGLR